MTWPLLGPAAAAVPVLLLACRICRDAEAGRLRSLAQAALELGETGKARQPEHVIPQCARLFLTWQPTDDGPEEGDPLRRSAG